MKSATVLMVASLALSWGQEALNRTGKCLQGPGETSSSSSVSTNPFVLNTAVGAQSSSEGPSSEFSVRPGK